MTTASKSKTTRSETSSGRSASTPAQSVAGTVPVPTMTETGPPSNALPHAVHRLREGAVHVVDRFISDVHDVAVVLQVMHLVPIERLRVINLDQDVPTPGRAVGPLVRDSLLHTAPVPRPRERLEGLAPCLIELGLGDTIAVGEPMDVHLSHFDLLVRFGGCAPPWPRSPPSERYECPSGRRERGTS